MNQTWLPSQTGPIVLMVTRRSLVIAGDERQQHRHAEIEAVHDRKADQQHAEQQPPDHPERFVVRIMAWLLIGGVA